jgi:hypothetical protein
MVYGAVLYHKDRKSAGRLSAYSTSVYNIPTGSESTQYEGFPVPRPEFVDLEDGQGHAFRKAGNYSVQTREKAYNSQMQNLMGNAPEQATYA